MGVPRVVLAGVLFVAAVTACGGGSGGGEAKSTRPATKTTADGKAAGGPVKVGETLTFQGVDYGLKVLEAKKAQTYGSGQSQASARPGDVLVVVRFSETGKVAKKSKIVLVDGRGKKRPPGLITFAISEEGKDTESTYVYGVPRRAAPGSKLRVKVGGHAGTVDLELS
jgi:hypothetical protein